MSLEGKLGDKKVTYVFWIVMINKLTLHELPHVILNDFISIPPALLGKYLIY